MKPYHIIAQEDETGYKVTIPEKPDFSAHVEDVSACLQRMVLCRN